MPRGIPHCGGNSGRGNLGGNFKGHFGPLGCRVHGPIHARNPQNSEGGLLWGLQKVLRQYPQKSSNMLSFGFPLSIFEFWGYFLGSFCRPIQHHFGFSWHFGPEGQRLQYMAAQFATTDEPTLLLHLLTTGELSLAPRHFSIPCFSLSKNKPQTITVQDGIVFACSIPCLLCVVFS